MKKERWEGGGIKGRIEGRHLNNRVRKKNLVIFFLFYSLKSRIIQVKIFSCFTFFCIQCVIYMEEDWGH